jgi:hypothetical protein
MIPPEDKTPRLYDPAYLARDADSQRCGRHRRESDELRYEIKIAVVIRNCYSVGLAERNQRVLGARKLKPCIAHINPHEVFWSRIHFDKGAQPKPRAAADIEYSPPGERLGDRAHERPKSAQLLRSQIRGVLVQTQPV